MHLHGIKYIFVDFFDTTIFRKVSEDQRLERWAFCIKRKFPELECYKNKQLVEYRKKSFNAARAKISDPCFVTAMEYMYDYVPELKHIERCIFCEAASVLDLSVEYGCHYPNRRLIRQLLNFKNEGKKIVCVSDFYHGTSVIKSFLRNCNIPEELFDDIFVSCECRLSKAKGTLYKHAMDSLGIKDPKTVLMIGDNFSSDKVQANNAGISARLRMRIIHKSIGKIKQYLNIEYSIRQMKDVGKACYKNGYPFSEYILVFYEFIKKLSIALKTDNVKHVSFMAREGYYLQKLYKTYSEICTPIGQDINTDYFKCSRRSIYSGVSEEDRQTDIWEPISLRNWLKSMDIPVKVIEKYVHIPDDELDKVLPIKENCVFRRLFDNDDFVAYYDGLISTNRKAFLQYIDQFLDDGQLYVVDSGWKGTTQVALYNYYHIPSTGYYIGIQAYPQCPEQVIRYGLIFEEPDSEYYDFVGMNFPFYQELLAAPHGSAIKYYFDSGEIKVKEEWDDLERNLYEKRISSLQDHMITLFMGLCAWNDNPSDKEDWMVAKTIFHSNMFVYGHRLEFAKDCENSFFINFQQEKRGAKDYDYKKVPLKLDIIKSPEKYIRYVTKIQRSKLYSHKVVQVLYPSIARCYYAYTLLLHYIKRGCV